MSYLVNEMFQSIQGEGVHAGVFCTFVRLQGCDVGCPWCDTKYAWKMNSEVGSTMTAQVIADRCRTEHIVITGGEPLLQNLDELLEILRDRGHYVQLETSGHHDFLGKKFPDWITWSPKFHLEYTDHQRYIFGRQEIKFVVDDRLSWLDISSFKNQLENHGVRPKFYVLMPEGCPPSQHNFNKVFEILHQIPIEDQHRWRYSDRLQWRVGVR